MGTLLLSVCDFFLNILLFTFQLISFQENCRRYLNVPPLEIDELSFKNLLIDANENDTIHDVIFHVEGETFVAHKYILFSRAKGLQSVVLPYGDKHIYLNYKGLSSKMFELMIKHIYCNHTLSLTGKYNLLEIHVLEWPTGFPLKVGFWYP